MTCKKDNLSKIVEKNNEIIENLYRKVQEKEKQC